MARVSPTPESAGPLRGIGVALAVAWSALLPRCGVLELPGVPYNPAVVFDGYIELPDGVASYTHLAGHSGKHNTCVLVGDTIRMKFYSGDYDDPQHGTWYGDQLWIDIYPFSRFTDPNYPRDTLIPWVPDSVNLLSLRSVLIKLSRYGQPTNATYRVSYRDSLYSPPLSAEMDIVRLERRRGGTINLKDVAATLAREGSSTPAVSIRNGTIVGQIE